MGMMLRRLGIAATLVVATVVSACDYAGQLLPPSNEASASTEATDREHEQAKAALQRWAAAVEAGGGAQSFVPVGELTGQIGNWEIAVGDNNKTALMAGQVIAATDLPVDAPGQGEVRWDDGTTTAVTLIPAVEALENVRAVESSDCSGCVPLIVTGARLSSAVYQTSRGPATAPAWEFSINGTSVVITRIAVARDAGVSVVPPPWDPNNAPSGISVESATGTFGGLTLTVTFIGAPGGADKPCGVDYTAEAVESDTAVVVIVTPHANGFGGACTLAGAERTALVTLAKPLGDRAVLEVKEGLPVPVTLTP